ncbi:MAG: LOG family protein [Candidatus Obscuribacterales bacterium]|nr:LOG family protein [Candidatus Obscuribacterales bacterium]
MENEKRRPGQTDVVLLSDEQSVSQVLVNVVENLWESVNELTRLRRTQNQNYFVTVFGSARIQAGTPAYLQARELTAELSKMGCGIITGGGPGLMQAANEGAASSGEHEKSIGIRIDLPFEQNANQFVGKAYQHKTFFSRLHHFVIASDAFIVLPGGIGTLLELSMIWQLLQVRKLYDTPLILIGDMWRDLVTWSGAYMLENGTPLASPVDLEIPKCVNTAAEAVELVAKHLERWKEIHGKS